MPAGSEGLTGGPEFWIQKTCRPVPPFYLLRTPPARDEPPGRETEDPGNDLPPGPANERGAIDRGEPDRMVPDAGREPAGFDDGRMARVGVLDG